MNTSQGRAGILIMLCIAAGFTPSCASDPAVRLAERQARSMQELAEMELSAAKAAVGAAETWEDRARLVRAYLDAADFPSALEAARRLPDEESHRAERLVLLGRAYIGMGHFRKASALLEQATRLDPDDGEAWAWFASVSIVLGEREVAREILEAAIKRWPDWGFYELLLELEGDDPHREREIVRAYLDRVPGDSEVKAYERLIDGRDSVSGTLVEGAGEVIRTRITDSLKVSVEIGGRRTYLLFDSSATGISIGDDLAALIGLRQRDRVVIRGMGGSGLDRAVGALVDDVRVGNARFEDVPVLIVQDLSTTQIDGVFGPDVFPGYAWHLDRKAETLTFYPPGWDVPEPTGEFVRQSYYRLGRHIVVDTWVRNRIRHPTTLFPARMIVDTGANRTILNRDYAMRFDWGNSNTLSTRLFWGMTGYGIATQVDFSEVRLAGVAFPFGSFPASSFKGFGRFTPYGILGRDILGRFRITVLPQSQEILFEHYEGASGWTSGNGKIPLVGSRVTAP